SNRIAHAILDNPAARHELAVDTSESVATAANKQLVAHKLPATVDGADPTLERAVEAALADPRIAANIVDAITADHASVLRAHSPGSRRGPAARPPPPGRQPPRPSSPPPFAPPSLPSTRSSPASCRRSPRRRCGSPRSRSRSPARPGNGRSDGCTCSPSALSPG